MSKPPPYRFVVRLPADMKDQILEAARLYRHSMNSELVARLQESLEGLPQVREDPADAPLNLRLEQVLRSELSGDEAALLRCFRKLGNSKRAALLKLLT